MEPKLLGRKHLYNNNYYYFYSVIKENDDNTYTYAIYVEKMYSNVKYRPETIHEFVSQYYDTKFMLIIEKFFKPYITLTYYEYSYHTSHKAKGKIVDDFIKEHLGNKKDYTMKELYRFFITTDRHYKPLLDEEIDRLLEKHLSKYYVKNDTVVDAEYCVRRARPYYSDFNDVQFKIMKHSGNKESSVGKENILLMYKLLHIIHDSKADDETLIKDYVIIENDALYRITDDDIRPNNKLPFKTVKFYDFINNLTVNELKKIYGKIGANVSTKTAINMAKQIIDDDKKIKKLTGTHVKSMMEKLRKKSNYDLTSDSYSYINVYLTNNYNGDNTHNKKVVYFLYDYINTVESINQNQFDGLMNVFIKKRNSWIKDKRSTFYVLHKLIEQVGMLEAVDLLISVSNFDSNLTIAQWDRIFENFNEFKDLQINLWRDLV